MFGGISSVPSWFYILAIAVIILFIIINGMEDAIKGDVLLTKKKVRKRQKPKMSADP